MISELLPGMKAQEVNQYFQNVIRSCRMYFKPNDSRMPAQGQYHPIAEMFVKSYQYTIFRNRFLQNLMIIGPRQACFGSTDNIITLFT